jgi:hypothetical protein
VFQRRQWWPAGDCGVPVAATVPGPRHTDLCR